MKKITTNELIANYIVGMDKTVLATRLIQLYDDCQLMKLANPVAIAIRMKPSFIEVLKEYFDGRRSIIEVTDVELICGNRVRVSYVGACERWFNSEESAAQASVKRNYYVGNSVKSDAYNISRNIEYDDDTTIDLENVAKGLEIDYL